MDTKLQSEKKCFFTGCTTELHKHHVFNGPNRKLAEEDGLWIWLRWDFHIENSPNRTPHNDAELDLMLKKIAQKKYEETHTREEFMSRYGRNYLESTDEDKA